jgi:hypothetical protein
MKKIISTIIILLCFATHSINAQSFSDDTVKTTVNLQKFKLEKKVVKAEYGRVIMYFNQTDYLKTQKDVDTVRITPKYFSDDIITDLLKKGSVKIIRRSDNSVVPKITHRIKIYGSQGQREFEFEDGEYFYSHLEIVGIMYDGMWSFPDSAELSKRDTIKPKKNYAYEEEFASTQIKKTIKIKDYFPNKPSSHYVYSNNNGYGELDSNVCKSGKLNNQDIFYYAECFDRFGLFSIGTTTFGPGIYFYKNDSLFAVDADYEKDIPEKNIKNATLLLPSYMSTGDSVIFDKGLEKQTFTYLLNEDIEIGDIIHKDCIKFKIIDNWPDTMYIQYFWLQKDIGLVKWMRSTGRIDELVNQF